MKIFRSGLPSLLLIVGLTGPVSPAQQPDEGARTKILALEHIWEQAQSLGDIKAVDALLDPELIYIGSDGALMGKAEVLSLVKSRPITAITEVEKVMVFDDTAIVNGTYRLKEMANGRTLMRQYRFTETWIYGNSTWVCITVQSTPVSQ